MACLRSLRAGIAPRMPALCFPRPDPRPREPSATQGVGEGGAQLHHTTATAANSLHLLDTPCRDPLPHDPLPHDPLPPHDHPRTLLEARHWLHDKQVESFGGVRGVALEMHSYDPLGTPVTTLASEHLQASVAPCEGGSVRTYQLSPHALWYPLGAVTDSGRVTYTMTYSALEHHALTQVPLTLPPEVNECHTTAATVHASGVDTNGAVLMSGAMSSGPEVLLCEGGQVAPGDGSGKPTQEHLINVYDTLAETLPKLFIQPMDYKIYHPNVVFENRIRGKVTTGIVAYVQQVALLRTIGHLKFAYVKFEVLKMTRHPEDGTVRVRWRIRGLSGLKAMFQFWKLKLWKWKTVTDEMESWYDGYSTFHVGGDGKVFKHVADSMMPDEEQRVVEKGPLAAKMAALLGLAHRPSLTDTNMMPFDLAAFTHALHQDHQTYGELMLPLEKIH